MSLLFGDLTQQFVTFSTVVAQAKNGVPGASEQIPTVAADFRHSAGQSASKLVYIGKLHIIRQRGFNI